MKLRVSKTNSQGCRQDFKTGHNPQNKHFKGSCTSTFEEIGIPAFTNPGKIQRERKGIVLDSPTYRNTFHPSGISVKTAQAKLIFCVVSNGCD